MIFNDKFPLVSMKWGTLYLNWNLQIIFPQFGQNCIAQICNETIKLPYKLAISTFHFNLPKKGVTNSCCSLMCEVTASKKFIIFKTLYMNLNDVYYSDHYSVYVFFLLTSRCKVTIHENMDSSHIIFLVCIYYARFVIN